MHISLKKILPLFILCLIPTVSFLSSGCESSTRQEVSPAVTTLDSLLLHDDDFILSHLTHIAELKQRRKNAKTTTDKYLYDNLLFEAYYMISADSALKYAEKTINDAQKTGNQEMINHAKLNKVSVLSATGLLNAALDIIGEINPQQLSKEQVVEYYGQMIFLYSHLGNYTGTPQSEYYVVERLYKDSILNVISPRHPDYLWYKAWDVIGSNKNSDSVLVALKEKVDQSTLSEWQDAKNAYVLARLYQERGDQKNYVEYMAKSAAADVRIGNSEIASIEELARFLFDHGKGDVDRAHTYINYSLNKAINYPNRARAFGIAKLLENVNSAYQEKIQRQQHHTHVFLVLLCVLAGILAFAVVAIIRQNKKLKSQSKDVDRVNDELSLKVAELSDAKGQLNGMNQQLKDLNEDLKRKNAELHEANFVKEEYIGYVFTLCSSYIAQIEDLKRNIYLKAVKKQLKDIEALTKDIDMKEDLKEFYKSFDSIFLNIYPNFVNDFNALLEPDKQIVLKEGEALNMELRIYALVRLGISDSVKIADFLHCAPQTVYNYRLRARSRAIYPKDIFLDKVKTLGSFVSKER